MRYYAKQARKEKIVFGSVIAIIILVIIVVLWTRTSYSGVVTGFYWERTYKIERFQTEQDSGWRLPSGAFHVSTSSRIHHYDDVYETRSVMDSDGGYELKRVKVGETPVYRTYYEYSINRWGYCQTLGTNGIDPYNRFWPGFVPALPDSMGLGATRIGQQEEKLSVNVKWTAKELTKTDLFTVKSYKGILIGDAVKVHYILGMPTGNLTFEPKAEAME